jgi:TetR/AcrR family transcriptional regulator, regulator of cefoperazone and chloramphenicol sensitivity
MTPPSARSRDTRQRLLEAAGEVFAERGFRDATTQEICRRAAANIAAVHYHFGDKEELYRTVIQYAEQRAAEGVPADLAPDAPAEERLRAHVESFLVHLFDEGQPAWLGKLMAREMSEPTPGLDVIVQEKIRVSYKRVEAIVRELVGPAASDDDVRACVLSVQGQCLFYRHCHPVLTRLFPGWAVCREGVPELARHIVRFSLAGIRATGSAG